MKGESEREREIHTQRKREKESYTQRTKMQ